MSPASTAATRAPRTRPAPARRRSLVVVFVSVSLFALAASVVHLLVGYYARLSVADVVASLVGGDVDAATRDIVRLDRLPRVALGLAVGGALAVAGTLFQAILRNPLADPYVSGVGPGAVFGAAAVGAIGLSSDSFLGLSASAGGAFVGAVVAAALVFAFAGRGAGAGRAASGRLLLAGVAVGSFFMAVAMAALYVKKDWDRSVAWLLGSLAFADGSRIALAAVATALLAAVAWTRARDLDALALGEEAARLVGVDVVRTVRGLAFVGCVLVASAVASVGLVGFVGLVVPHLARALVGPAHRRVVLVALPLGAGLVVAADVLARCGPTEIPVGVVTALLGAPVFAVLVRRTPTAE